MTDYADLVKYLRDYAPAIGEDCTPSVEKRVIEAAEAIEALVQERDDALSVRPAMQEWIDHHYARAEAAEAEVAALKAQQKADDEHALKTANALKVFVDENAKLKEALTKIADSDNWPGNIAKRALEGS